MKGREVAEWIHAYGFWAVFLGAVLEGEMVLIVAGYAVSQGLLPPAPTLAVAALGATLGDHGFFMVGRTWGTSLLRRSPRLRRLRAHAALLVRRWGRAAAFVLRFTYGLRGVLPLGLGAARFPPRLFIPFNVLGALTFACVYLSLGYFFGEAAEAVFARARGHAGTAALVFAVAALLWLIRRLRTGICARTEVRDGVH
jgi:membrane protein DedA with SNARE-associated domain